MKCLYHSADLDGHCSGAIVKYFYPQCETIPINYGDECPKFRAWEIIVIVDFSLPRNTMEDLTRTNHVRWMDHHKTAIEEMEGLHIPGIREIGKGACELTWNYFSGYKLPKAVRLLSLYDVWDHEDPEVLEFQYGMRIEPDTSPENVNLWKPLLYDDTTKVSSIKNAGKTILQYEKEQNKKYCDSCALPLSFEGLTFMAMNKPMSNSKVMDSIYNPDEHDGVLFFAYRHGKGWTISIFSDTIDVGAIAKRHGGGGHKGAAGFIIDDINEILPKEM